MPEPAPTLTALAHWLASAAMSHALSRDRILTLLERAKDRRIAETEIAEPSLP